MLKVLYPYFHSPATFPFTYIMGSAIAPSKLRMARGQSLSTWNVVRYHPSPTHGREPERPVFSEASFSPFCSIATVCLSISLSKGPAIAQSCGTETVCHLLSLKPVCASSGTRFKSVLIPSAAVNLSAGVSFFALDAFLSLFSTRVNFHPSLSNVSLRCANDRVLAVAMPASKRHRKAYVFVKVIGIAVCICFLFGL